MYVEQKFFIGFQDIGLNNQITNKAILGFLEDAAGIHSNIAGYGVNDIARTKLSWVILNWKVKVIKRPNYAEIITVRTWSSRADKLYAYRDYEVFSSEGELIAIATSKWVMINIETGRIEKLTDEIISTYETEHRFVFPEYNYDRLKEPETVLETTQYTINRQMIDVNKHVHNVYYYDIAEIAIPEEVLDNKLFNDIEIMYKKETKLGETVNCDYSSQDGITTVVIKSEDRKNLHAIIKLK